MQKLATEDTYTEADNLSSKKYSKKQLFEAKKRQELDNIQKRLEQLQKKWGWNLSEFEEKVQ